MFIDLLFLYSVLDSAQHRAWNSDILCSPHQALGQVGKNLDFTTKQSIVRNVSNILWYVILDKSFVFSDFDFHIGSVDTVESLQYGCKFFTASL